MIKNSIERKLVISFLSLVVLFLIYIIPSEESYEPPINENLSSNIVYLLNNNLITQTKMVGNTKNIDSQIKDIIDALTINGSKSKYLNNDFQALIPANTKLLDYSLDNGILKLNFSQEYNNLSQNLAEKALESLIYSLTELNEVKGIMVFVEGVKLETLPSGKILPNVLTREFGINKIYDLTSLNNVNQATMYYFLQNNNDINLVPVTIFSNEDINKVDVIIEELKSSPIYYTNLMSFLSANTKILDYEILENSVKLNFNNYLLDSFFEDSLIEEVKYAISYSLKDSLGLENITFFVNGEEI